MRPRLLPTVVTLLSLFNLAGFACVDPSKKIFVIELFVATVIVLISFVVIWRFWRGSKLSRILVLITSAIAILNLFFLSSSTPFDQAVIIGEAIFAVFLIYWLFTAQVRSFFAAGPKL